MSGNTFSSGCPRATASRSPVSSSADRLRKSRLPAASVVKTASAMASSAFVALPARPMAASSRSRAATSCTTAITSPSGDPTTGVSETSTGNSPPSARRPVRPGRWLIARIVGAVA